MTDDQIRDLVKDADLDWQRGYTPLFDGDDTNRYAVLVRAALEAQAGEIERLKAATQLCDKHAPSGGTRGACVICSGEKLSHALSRISYLCEPPNEMDWSSYDFHYDEDAVVAQVELLKVELLKAEMLREHADHVEANLDAASVVQENRALQAEVERLRKDAARLDHIEGNARCDPKMDGQSVWWPTSFNHRLTGPTLRAAIDAAMEKPA